MYSEIEIAKLCDALSAYKRKKAKTKIKQLIDIGKMHETVVGVAVTAVVLMAYTNRVVKKVYNKSLRNNFAYKIVLGCSDSDTQEYFSRLIGEKEVYRKAVSKNGKQVTNTRTEAKERIVPPAELARLGRHMILLAEGKYYKLTKNYYFELDLWDRVKKCINNLSRIQEEDFSEKNTLSLTDENK